MFNKFKFNFCSRQTSRRKSGSRMLEVRSWYSGWMGHLLFQGISYVVVVIFLLFNNNKTIILLLLLSLAVSGYRCQYFICCCCYFCYFCYCHDTAGEWVTDFYFWFLERALGDFEYKNVDGKGPTEQLVSPEPEFYIKVLTPIRT